MHIQEKAVTRKKVAWKNHRPLEHIVMAGPWIRALDHYRDSISMICHITCSAGRRNLGNMTRVR